VVLPARVSVPPPILVSPPAPTMLPDSVSAFACVSTVLVPLSVIALASESPLAAACSVVPLAKVRSPVPSALLDPAASVPAFMVVPPEYVFVPESVSVPAPIFVSPPVPESVEASVTLLPLVSKVAPLLPKAASLEEMSVEVPDAHCRPPPLSVIKPEPKLPAELKLISPPVTLVPPE
jgi:hypothetical protein